MNGTETVPTACHSKKFIYINQYVTTENASSRATMIRQKINEINTGTEAIDVNAERTSGDFCADPVPAAQPGYRKLMSGPAGPGTNFELHVEGPVTAKELYRIANAIMQVHGWLSSDEKPNDVQ